MLVQQIVAVLRNAERLRGGTFKPDLSRSEAAAVDEARVQGWLTRENAMTDAGRAALERLERDLG